MMTENQIDAARSAAARRLIANPISSTEKTASPTPKWSADWRSIRPAGSGRPRVRFICASRSASYHMLSAPAAPAPSAMHSTAVNRSEEHTSELQSLMRISYAVFCLKKKNNKITTKNVLDRDYKKTKTRQQQDRTQ